jgi:hypothetical protein
MGSVHALGALYRELDSPEQNINYIYLICAKLASIRIMSTDWLAQGQANVYITLYGGCRDYYVGHVTVLINQCLVVGVYKRNRCRTSVDTTCLFYLNTIPSITSKLILLFFIWNRLILEKNV